MILDICRNWNWFGVNQNAFNMAFSSFFGIPQSLFNCFSC